MRAYELQMKNDIMMMINYKRNKYLLTVSVNWRSSSKTRLKSGRNILKPDLVTHLEYIWHKTIKFTFFCTCLHLRVLKFAWISIWILFSADKLLLMIGLEKLFKAFANDCSSWPWEESAQTRRSRRPNSLSCAGCQCGRFLAHN